MGRVAPDRELQLRPGHGAGLCPVCSRETEVVFGGIEGRYIMLRCAACSVEFASPLEPAGTVEYDKSYNRPAGGRRPRTVREALTRIRQAPRYKAFFNQVPISPGVRLLDIGCGTGAFLVEAARRGADVYGVDLAASAVSYARTEFGLRNVAVVAEGQLPDEWGYFDVITAFEVVEHITSPRGLVAWGFEHLRPAGSFFITVPDAERLEVKVGRRPAGDRPPNHLTRWCPQALEKLLWTQPWCEVRVSRTALELTEVLAAVAPRAPRTTKGTNMVRASQHHGFVGSLIRRSQVPGMIRDAANRLLWHAFPLCARVGVYGHSLVGQAVRSRETR